MESQDIVGSNINKIAQLFPNCVTERKGKDGKTELAIDFEKLQAELSDDIIGEGEERYQFTWPDKRAANRLANSPTTMTLRPCREDSVDFDKTQNIYIEGDNLDVLKVLRETYLGKVKMIYIDPPYNTGNDFVYNDDFAKGKDKFEQTSGFFDEEGNQTVDPMQRNMESNGRFHTDWLNMMYPRLKVARDLLTDDGVIFISIDDNEIENLRKVCNEIFGENNFVVEIPWQSRASIQNDTDFSINHEYICVFSKKRRQENRRLKESNYREWFKNDSFVCRPLPLDKSKFDNPDNDPRGLWKADPFDAPNIRPNLTYPIVNPLTGEKHLPPRGRCWRTDSYQFANALNDNRILFGKDGCGRPQLKVFYYEKKDFGSIDNSWFSADRIGTTTNGTKEVMNLFKGHKFFDMPKPVSLLQKLLYIGNVKHTDIILDFFSGSSTTAHAVMQFNIEYKENCKFIMVQIPEPTNEKSEAYKAGYKNICEIGEERIRRAGKKIVKDLKSEIDTKERLLDRILNAEPSATVKILPIEEQKEIAKKVYEEKAVPLMKEIDEIKERIEKLDTGFRVFKLDTSNMEDVYYTPQEFDEQKLFTDNVKADRTNEDLLFQVMLDLGIELSAKIEVKEIAGKTVHIVDENYLVACFDEDVNETTIKEIAKLKPVYFVMRDASAANDNVIDNFDQLFEAYSKDTVRKIL